MRKSLAVMALVTGCASVPTIGQLAASCEAYGFQRGSTEHARCVERQVLAYQDRQAIFAGQAQARSIEVFRTPQPVQPQMPITCTTLGAFTNCY